MENAPLAANSKSAWAYYWHSKWKNGCTEIWHL